MHANRKQGRIVVLVLGKEQGDVQHWDTTGRKGWEKSPVLADRNRVGLDGSPLNGLPTMGQGRGVAH